MIIYKSPREIELMRIAGKVVAGALRLAKEISKIGVTTEYIDKQLEDYLIQHDCRPIFKGYKGFPKSICASINEEIVHGIPGNRRLANGDILSIDIGAEYKRYMADAAITLPIGKITTLGEKLLVNCKNALLLAIKTIRSGIKLSEVCIAIQDYVEQQGFSVIRDYTGHGIGRKMHEDPQVPNFVDKTVLERDVILCSGITLAIEPMISVGSYETEVLKNNWTVITKDRSLSAHFEHTIAVTDYGADVLTVEDGKLFIDD